MTIGTSLFHQINADSLNRLSGKISDLQGQISSGKADRRPSVDPVPALRLSAAQEQKDMLEKFSTNIERTMSRLDQADSVMEGVMDVMQRVGELSVRAASDSVTADERATIAIEVSELRRSLMDLANTRDDSGRALFAGFRSDITPFVEGPEGVTYMGDTGQHRLQVSESVSLETGLSGADVFGGTPRGDVFKAIDGFLQTLSMNDVRTRDSVASQGEMTVKLPLSQDPISFSLDVEGPLGRAAVAFDTSSTTLAVAAEAINAKTDETGVTASLSDDGTYLVLSPTQQGAVRLEGLTIRPESAAAAVEVTDTAGQETALLPAHMTRGAQIGILSDISGHFADQRARIGAISQSAEKMEDVISSRQVVMDKAIAGLEDLDLASAITRLQQLMLTRDATQQAYVKISQKSLFDYIR